METLATLHAAQNDDASESKFSDRVKLSGKVVAGLVGAACLASVVGIADQASAYPCYRPYYRSYYPSYYNYYRPYYSPYYYRPYYRSYYPSYYPSSYYPSSYYAPVSYYTPGYDYYSTYTSYYYGGYVPVSSVNTNPVAELQTKLADLGYYTGSIDGDYGPETANAVAAYQSDNGLQVDGVVGAETGSSLGLGAS